MPLFDYLNYIDISQSTRVVSIRSFFSESCILILFEMHKNSSSSSSDILPQSEPYQIILGYSIVEDQVLFHQKVVNAKFIAPITSSRSFLVVDSSDIISWYVYPLISDTLPYIFKSPTNNNNNQTDDPTEELQKIVTDTDDYTALPTRPIRSKL